MGLLKTWEVFVNGAGWAMILTVAAVRWWPGHHLLEATWALISVASAASGVTVFRRSIKAQWAKRAGA